MASTALKNVFATMKTTGIVKLLDQHLIRVENEEDGDRKNETNSPSGALGCCRANYYQRMGTKKDPIAPRTRRIFDNGHHVHDRLQTYLEDAGVLLMREVPLYHKGDQIQGHTDGLMDLTGRREEVVILEIKSINDMQYKSLKKAKEDHIAQGNTYLYCLEEHRLYLRKKYPTKEDFERSAFYRRLKYAQLYKHLKSGNKYTKAEKIKFKVGQHMQCDEILYNLKKPINRVIFLYEDKNDQDLKDFDTTRNDEVLNEVLAKYRLNNKYFAEKKLPPKECKNKSEGKFCSYLSTCFPS
ncbi:hypothetical protein D1872_81320 [compost metagenome]